VINDNSIENDKPEPNDTVSILPITAHIEERLTNRLPNYMILTVLFSMKELPMTRTGKTDRRQLREIGASFSVQQLAEMRTAGQVTKRQPTCDTEKRMQRIWAQVLNIDPASIGLDDSFFQLRGDSITAMKVVGETRKVAIDVSVADIFCHPTLEHIARRYILNRERPNDEFH
jgi:aryl carrier-like protein